MHVLLLIVALLAGLVAAWMAVRASALRVTALSERARAERTEHDYTQARAQLETLGRERNEFENRSIALEKDLHAARTGHEEEFRRVREVAEEKLAGVQERERRIREDFALFEQKMQQSFKALAGDALRGNTTEFMKLAGETLSRQTLAGAGELDKKRVAFEQLVRPLSETLQRTDAKLAEFDKGRASAHAALSEQVRQMTDASLRLQAETRRLGDALRKPEVRGAYGEMQLRRVAELAGMTAYCDFSVQSTLAGPEGEALRPDMIVKLPSGRAVAVDAKTNIQAYLDAVQAPTPDDADEHLDRFARHVSEQATKLGKKEYWRALEGSPEFVVMFVPGDQFIDAALARQPELLDSAYRQGVILASPATLIGLLRAVAVGYKEARLAQTAEELRALGREFHERMATALEPLKSLGSDLDSAARKYNQFVASYESRLRPTLEKFEESGVRGKKDLPHVVTISTSSRALDLPPVRREKNGE
jgi:DNA recombination protein RmuC